MAWRPTGGVGASTVLSNTVEHRRMHGMYRTGEASLRNKDLELTATGRAMALPPKTGSLRTAPSPSRLPRRNLDNYSDATMATQQAPALAGVRSRGRSPKKPYWNNPRTFSMYETTYGRSHKGRALPPVLAHPSYERAPNATRVAAVDNADVLSTRSFELTVRGRAMEAEGGSPNAARRHGMSTETRDAFGNPPEKKDNDLAAVEAAAERAMAEADAKEAHAYRPLVTTDPSALPFGSHRVESETQSAYRVPSRGADIPVTFWSEHPEAADKASDRQRAIWEATRQGSAGGTGARPQTSPGRLRSTTKQTFRPVGRRGMRSTYMDTHSELAPAIPEEPVRNYMAEAASRALSIPSKAVTKDDFGIPNMYSTSSRDYGAFERDPRLRPVRGRPQTSPGRARDTLRGPSNENDPTAPGNLWLSTGVRQRGEFEPQPPKTTEYRDEFVRDSPVFTRRHHLW